MRRVKMLRSLARRDMTEISLRTIRRPRHDQASNAGVSDQVSLLLHHGGFTNNRRTSGRHGSRIPEALKTRPKSGAADTSSTR